MKMRAALCAALSAVALCTVRAKASEQPTPSRAGMTPNSWRAGDGAQPARPDPAGRGVFFPGPAAGGSERVFWECETRLNLSGASTLELEFYCTRPQGVRNIMLYLKSGTGWYVWSAGLKEGGRQKLMFFADTASTEGKPAGWSEIGGVRLAAHPAPESFQGLTLSSMRAIKPAILLVRPSSSAPNAAERNAGAKAASRISVWLSDMEIPHAFLSDDAMAGADLAGIKTVILPYNPNPGKAQKSKLMEHIAHGGKLMVFYGADPDIAAKMGMKLGQYTAASRAGQWAGFAFAKNTPAGLPQAVRQESTSIRPVYPDSPDAAIAAYWRDSAGRTSREPAWVISDKGAWMTHIPLPGDDENKKLMLLGFLAAHDPGLPQTAARRYADWAGKIGTSDGIRSSLEEILAAAAGSSRSETVSKRLPEAYRLHEDLRQAIENRDFPSAINKCVELKKTLTELYSLAQPGKAKEFRGVWNHSGLGLGPGQWKETCSMLAANGVTAVFPNMLWPGRAHYPSGNLAMSDTAARMGDQLRQCLDAAHARGLEVHVWKVCWRLDWAPPETRDAMRKAGRLQVSGDGTALNWLCPALPENVEYELAALRELAGKYEIDGIHLDYARYPDSRACVCRTCRSLFEKETGLTAGAWPADVLAGGRLARAFAEWRARLMTGFVGMAARETRKIRPSVKISAAVYSRYPECASSVGQDWAEWLKRGHVDFVCPMNYLEEPGMFAWTLAAQFSVPGTTAGRIVPGLGVIASESRLAPDKTIWQIREARRRGAGGIMLFDLGPELAGETLPLLGLGVFNTE